MRPRLLAAWLILAATVMPLRAAETDSLAAIDACISRLDAQVDVGYERIAARCPDLTAALGKSGWAQWLPHGWNEPRNDLSAGSLAELRATVERELAPRPAVRTMTVERAKAALADLGAAGQERSGVWARFKQWLRSIFERRNQQSGEGWLSRMFDRIGVTDAAIEMITYITLGAVVALAAFIVFNELRAAGVVGRRRTPRNAGGDADALNAKLRPTLRDVEQAALLERPRLLLEMIAAKLTDLKRLPPAGAFTVRELTRAAQLREEADRSRLSELALTAERARFAEGGIETSLVDRAVAHGRALLTSLETPEHDALADSKP